MQPATTDLFSHVQASTQSPSRDPASPLSPPASRSLLCQLLGHANEFKEGDETVGVAAGSTASPERAFARTLIAHTTVQDVDAFPVFRDAQYELCRAGAVSSPQYEGIRHVTIGQLKARILDPAVTDEDIHRDILPALSSDVVAFLVKTMTNEELTLLGSKVFNPIPGTKLGAKGYFGARCQPNSPTDDPEDIIWECFNSFSFAVGDVMLGVNPVSSDPNSVLRIELALKDLVHTFGLQDVLPYVVLAHIDIQDQLEKHYPGSTTLWFQSIAGSDAANQTFDLSVEKMLKHADKRTGKFGFYLETGQGADFTNGHAKGVDMIMHESRKYGLARALRERIGQAQVRAGNGSVGAAPRIYINDVAGFIGPEVFRSKEQLVRCTLEDIAMGKLHGLATGLDVCTTLHMDVSLDDLDWCLDRILPACPAWCMALPTKNDPMLSYLTTSFQDHVRLRHKFGVRVDDTMMRFFVDELQVVREDGSPGAHFGDPVWVYIQYCRRKGDTRSEEEIRKEGMAKVHAVKARGVPIAVGHGEHPWSLVPDLDREMRELYKDAKRTLWSEFSPAFLEQIPRRVMLHTRSVDRKEYVWHPESGEKLSPDSEAVLQGMREAWQPGALALLISDGLCADAISDRGHLVPFLDQFTKAITEGSHSLPFALPPHNLVVLRGRVRAGYHAGEVLFGNTNTGNASQPCAVVHVIGERPGNGHHTFSVYLTVAPREAWSHARRVDHDITRVVSGIADTSYDPVKAASECVDILHALTRSLQVTRSSPRKMPRLATETASAAGVLSEDALSFSPRGFYL